MFSQCALHAVFCLMGCSSIVMMTLIPELQKSVCLSGQCLYTYDRLLVSVISLENCEENVEDVRHRSSYTCKVADDVFLFPGVPYQLDQLLNETHNQPKLSAFFSSKSNSSSNIDDAAKVGECIDHKSQLGEESASHMDDNSRDMRKAEPSSADSEDKASVGEAFQSSDSSPHKPSTTVVSGCCSGDKSSNEPLASGILGPPYPSHSTLGDPNFVENYFKVIKYHFYF